MKKLNNNLPVVSAAVLLLMPLASQAEIKYTVKSFVSFSSIEGLLTTILTVFITIATPIIVMFIIYAGFLYVTAKGNAEQTKQATRALTYAVIGGVLELGAVALGRILENLVGSFTAS